MKKKVVKVLTTVMVAGCLVTGCGGVKKPSGTYQNSTVSFTFSKEQVVVQEGNATITSDYEIDDNGVLTFDLEGEEVTCTYDTENDKIDFYGESYTK